jgi:hypothetical protein
MRTDVELPIDEEKPTNEVIEYPAPDLTLSRIPETPWERERRAFWKLLPELLKTHRGQYATIHNGEVVTSGSDEIAVAMEAYSRVGYVPLYVSQVTDDPPQPARIPSPRIWREKRSS